MGRLIFVDVEGPPSPAVGNISEFGAVDYKTKETFHGKDFSKEVFEAFEEWLEQWEGPYVFVSDNPAFDWQWINYYFWLYKGYNPFGHSARRISDFYAGLVGNFKKSQEWKQYRRTPHDHNPVNDAMGNVEAFEVLEQMASALGGKST